MSIRRELLLKLINFEEPLELVLKKLDSFNWDSEELVFLTHQHFSHILLDYIEGKISATDVEDWAGAIECRYDIGVENSSRDILREIIWELAHPELTEELTKDRAKILYDSLISEGKCEK